MEEKLGKAEKMPKNQTSAYSIKIFAFKLLAFEAKTTNIQLIAYGQGFQLAYSPEFDCLGGASFCSKGAY